MTHTQPKAQRLTAAQRIALEYSKMPPETVCDEFLQGKWVTKTARDWVRHYEQPKEEA